MANEPKHAKEKRPDPGPRRNAQGDQEGSAHRPEAFDVMNPQKQGLGDDKNLGHGKTATAPKPAPQKR